MCLCIYTLFLHIYSHSYPYYICTPSHCSKSLPSRNVSNAMFLNVRGGQMFRTPCSQHVFPLTTLRRGKHVANNAFDTVAGTDKLFDGCCIKTYIYIYIYIYDNIYTQI